MTRKTFALAAVAVLAAAAAAAGGAITVNKYVEARVAVATKIGYYDGYYAHDGYDMMKSVGQLCDAAVKLHVKRGENKEAEALFVECPTYYAKAEDFKPKTDAFGNALKK
jgi:shikimate kinase